MDRKYIGAVQSGIVIIFPVELNFWRYFAKCRFSDFYLLWVCMEMIAISQKIMNEYILDQCIWDLIFVLINMKFEHFSKIALVLSVIIDCCFTDKSSAILQLLFCSDMEGNELALCSRGGLWFYCLKNIILTFKKLGLIIYRVLYEISFDEFFNLTISYVFRFSKVTEDLISFIYLQN